MHYLLTFNFWGVKKCRLDLDSTPKSSSLWCQNIIFWVRQAGWSCLKEDPEWRLLSHIIKRKKEVIEFRNTKITSVLYSFILPESSLPKWRLREPQWPRGMKIIITWNPHIRLVILNKKLKVRKFLKVTKKPPSFVFHEWETEESC